MADAKTSEWRRMPEEHSGRWVAETGGPSGLGAWSDYRIIPCADGKARRIESSIQPLAHGIPGRVGLLRGYGNAIVPQVAAAFVAEFMGLFQPTNREETVL
jgi:DNA (cytosine-5)-methyltransferase 1